ncbi:carboxylesterase 1D-like [Amblyomma americanum]
MVCLQVTPNGSNSEWPQSPADRGGYAQPIEYSEDCLYLNVWSPAEPCDYTSSSCGPALPVLAVLFSVGFVRGGADWYDGAVLASLSGMVVVAPNFRLGPLAVPIKEKNPQGLPLLTSSDQLQAIHWMWHNIRHFGGNISQINVLGAGGGAWTVGELLLSNRESFRDRIQRVALHGGSPLRSNVLYGRANGPTVESGSSS